MIAFSRVFCDSDLARVQDVRASVMLGESQGVPSRLKQNKTKAKFTSIWEGNSTLVSF